MASRTRRMLSSSSATRTRLTSRAAAVTAARAYRVRTEDVEVETAVWPAASVTGGGVGASRFVASTGSVCGRRTGWGGGGGGGRVDGAGLGPAESVAGGGGDPLRAPAGKETP